VPSLSNPAPVLWHPMSCIKKSCCIMCSMDVSAAPQKRFGQYLYFFPTFSPWWFSNSPPYLWPFHVRHPFFVVPFCKYQFHPFSVGIFILCFSTDRFYVAVQIPGFHSAMPLVLPPLPAQVRYVFHTTFRTTLSQNPPMQHFFLIK